MNPITALFDATARRERQQKARQADLVVLRRDFSTAVSEGDDDKADKISAKIDKAEATLRAVQRAIAETKRQASVKQQAAQVDARKAELTAFAQEVRDVMALARDFEATALVALVEAWQRYEAKYEHVSVQARPRGLGASLIDVAPLKVWTTVFRRFTARIQREERPPMLLPQTRSRSVTPDPLAVPLAKLEEALQALIQGVEPSAPAAQETQEEAA
jgi:hypothetical protein